MSYFTAWLSLIGWNELACIAVIGALLWLADRAILWHDKHPWCGLLNRTTPR